MGRKSSGGPIGRRNSFQGEQLAWLDERCPNFLAAGDNGAFYTRTAQEFIETFGYSYKSEDNSDENLSTQEKAEVYDDLRSKLSRWFRNRTKEKTKPLMDKILAVAGDLSAGRPRKKRLLQVYANKHYQARIKAAFDNFWASQKGVIPASERLSSMADWIKSSWEAESDQFRAEFTQEFEQEYQAQLERFKAGKAHHPDSPEGFAEAWENFDGIAVALTDAVGEYIGGPIFLIAVVPVGTDNGEINVRMSQSRINKDGVNDGTTKLPFPFFNRTRYDQLHEALVDYGRAYFTKEQCATRVTNVSESKEQSGYQDTGASVIKPDGHTASAGLHSDNYNLAAGSTTFSLSDLAKTAIATVGNPPGSHMQSTLTDQARPPLMSPHGLLRLDPELEPYGSHASDYAHSSLNQDWPMQSPVPALQPPSLDHHEGLRVPSSTGREARQNQGFESNNVENSSISYGPNICVVAHSRAQEERAQTATTLPQNQTTSPPTAPSDAGAISQAGLSIPPSEAPAVLSSSVVQNTRKRPPKRTAKSAKDQNKENTASAIAHEDGPAKKRIRRLPIRPDAKWSKNQK